MPLVTHFVVGARCCHGNWWGCHSNPVVAKLLAKASSYEAALENGTASKVGEREGREGRREGEGGEGGEGRLEGGREGGRGGKAGEGGREGGA